jgi:acyl-CoA dehydrogenase
VEPLRAAVREFLAGGGFEPRCDAWLSGHDPAFSRRLAARGWIGMTWPRRYGGQERSYLERSAVLEELLAAGAPVAAHWIADRQTGPLLLRYGTEPQRERFLPAIARGECFFAIGMSEPDSGSDLASVRTRATPVEGGWRLRGTKLWTSHAHRSHYAIALVRTSPGEERRHEGLSQLIVDLRGEGVRVRPIRLLSGEEHFAEVVFEDAFVPRELLVGREGDGWRQVTSELAYERSGPERFLSTFPLLVELARELGPEPDRAGARALGELAARLCALRALSMEVARRLQAGAVPAVEAALVKDAGTRFERDLVEVARLQVPPEEAGEGFRRRYREAVAAAPGFTLRGGSSEILRGIVARALRPAGEGSATGPAEPAVGGGAEVVGLLLETAHRVFGRESSDPWDEVRRAGLDALAGDHPEIGLAEVAAVVRVSAYHATEIPFAERVMLEPLVAAGAAPDRLRRRTALMRSAQMVGALERVQELTVTYAAERRQFGQPLNRFQAVQQQLAELAGEVALARAAVEAAAADPTALRVAAARVVAGRAAGRASAIAHQVHGAIGFTQEHRLHRFTTRLWRWRDEQGTEAAWAESLGTLLARAGADRVWEVLTE